MPSFISIFLPFLLVLLGIVFLFLYLKEQQQRRSEQRLSKEERDTLLRQLEQTNQEKDRYLKEKYELSNQLTEQRVLNEGLQKQVAEQLQKQKDLLAENRLRFESLSNKLLEEKASRFAKQNEENLGRLLKPFQEKIKEFEKKVGENYQRSSNEIFSLKNELRRTLELNKTLSQQADNLTRALKSDSKAQGNWGEYLLEKILESAGLQEGTHFKKQLTVKGENNRTLRPDVVVYLPENKHIVIDAKVSLTAYERYFSETEEAKKQSALKNHIVSIKNHIDELSHKKYERFFEYSPDFVLMFIPVEPAYNLALMTHPDLYEQAFKKKVILVSVSSLMATLRIIESVWRLENQNKNAWQIIEEGNKLYDKLVGFVSDLENVGQKLSGAQASYDQAFKKLSSGRGNLISRAEKMKALGLNPSKQLPGSQKLLKDK